MMFLRRACDMKKRIVSILTAVSVLAGSVVVSFAENNETDDKREPLFEAIPVESMSTGTQERAMSDEEDVDEDIREEIELIIPDDYEEIRISSAADIIDLAGKCRLDTWSANKVIVLTQDIDLIGKEFSGIPYFDGIFDGQGHTIKEFNITGDISYAGFFSRLGKEAVIKNLNISGSVITGAENVMIGGLAGDNSGVIRDCSFKGVVRGVDYIGGLVGINELSGEIAFCSNEGYVNGTHFVGGIAGENMGNIANCINNGNINTSINDSGISIDALETLNTVMNFIKNRSGSEDTASVDSTISDIGGIAGLSIGIISRSINNGETGYEHVGYNIGGIAGRQSGYIVSCSNNAAVKGRKDIGGICGQAEPYITVDLSSDIAYQLSESISKLHDTVSATLNDAKRQSDTVSQRLAVIQKFTAGAVDDTRFIASGTVDFINGVAGATNSAISRIDYVIDESSKEGGFMDQSVSAAENAEDTISDIHDTVKDIDIYQYLTDGEKEDYDRAHDALDSIEAQRSELYDAAYTPYYNEFIHNNAQQFASDLKFRRSDDDFEDPYEGADAYADLTGSDGSGSGITLWQGDWVHYESDDSYEDFPSEDDGDQADKDKKLRKLAKAHAVKNAEEYVRENYVSPPGYGGNDIEADAEAASQTIIELTYRHLQDMTDTARSDAQSAVNSFEEATSDLTGSLKSARSIARGLSGSGDFAMPTLSDEYRAHTTSLADNMQGMNDNFGLLNNEVNNASGVLIDDLQELSDQFNNILMLYTDAIDGVLEKDYNNIFSDESLAEAAYTTDATIDSCLNFGTCEGDINTSGIAGTMAIEYDFDKESQLTGIKDTKLNTSFITKCVLRGNRNYGTAKGFKDYTGGICGKQEMGTVLSCGNYARIESTDGSYVGGVAGASMSYILESFAKGELEGTSYVGGIAGDGKNIRKCLSLVTVDNATSWYGAIAGHVDEQGEIRENYFVSDDLAGIDRVSYSLKAEPVSYSDIINNKLFDKAETGDENSGQEADTDDAGSKAVNVSTESSRTPEERKIPIGIPGEFSSLSVRFVLNDDEIEGGSKLIGSINKKYGDKLDMSEYPSVEEREGFYTDWDVDGVESLTNDITVNATYKRYRTTIATSNPNNDLYMSDLLVDGLFREEDELKVERTVFAAEEKADDGDITLIEKLDVTVPDDESQSHKVRFKPVDDYSELISSKIGKFSNVDFALFLETDDGMRELKPSGTMGKYRVYDIEGNNFSLLYGYRGVAKLGILLYVLAILVIILILAIIVINIVLIIRNHNKAKKMLEDVREKVTAKIDSKEQLFYDDSAEDAPKKSADEKGEASDTDKALEDAPAPADDSDMQAEEPDASDDSKEDDKEAGSMQEEAPEEKEDLKE